MGQGEYRADGGTAGQVPASAVLAPRVRLAEVPRAGEESIEHS